ncbi:hypothetical protein HN587_03210 [Candidatus Woesearchaeota archaeon]|jgi:hypothetical protein|nr:hypothetical protein [Candidatus Woesearchaeota archaeon]
MDAFEAKIKRLHDVYFPVWNSGKIGKMPEGKEKDRKVQVIYLQVLYDYYHAVERDGFEHDSRFILHTNPLNYYSMPWCGTPLEWNEASLGISPGGVKRLLTSLEQSCAEGDVKTHLRDLVIAIGVERKMYEALE